MNKEPFNIWLIDMDKVIKERNLQEVTSEFIKESSSNRFHPQGLFSEQIFGPIASQDRMKRCGYIKLNCRVFHPIIFQNLQAIKRFYIEILAGNSYAVWDAEQGDFVRSSQTEHGANTGFAFFLKYFDKINFKKNFSLKRNDRIEVIMKYQKERLIDKMLVIPAGERDMREDAGRMEKDSINSLYSSLLRNAKSMTKGEDTNALFDTVHYTIQKRVVEIYEKVAEMVRGKRGFMEGKYARRNVARSTRNVITASDMDASDPDSPQYHKTDESKVPLFQAAKGGANYLVYWYKTLFYDQVVNMSSENVALINPKTLNLEYVQLDPSDKDKFTTAEGIEKTIDRFRDPFNRFKEVVIQSNDRPYYMFMIYDRGDRVHVVRNVEEFKKQFTDAGFTYDPTKLRPITQAEMLYIACFFAYRGVCATVTRYPVTDEQSIYVSKTHLMSTSPARVVRFCQGINDDPSDQILPEYPILGNKFVDALMLHPTRLKSLNGDFDGNCVVGESRVEIRFTDAWLKTCFKINNLEALHTDQDVTACLQCIDSAVYMVHNGLNYAEIRIDQMPQLGVYEVDKNGAKVYDIPEGVEVLSYFKGTATYLPLTKVTVEDNCSVAEVTTGGRKVIVSTNKSIAAFDHKTGKLEKISPASARNDRLVPYVKHAKRWLINPDLRFADGYKMGLTNAQMHEINSYLLRSVSDECLAGYLAAIVDKFGRVEKDYSSLGITIMFEVDDDLDVEGLKKMLYTMGIRFTQVTNDGVCMMVIIGRDLIRYSGYLHFKNRMNQKIYRNWADTSRITYDYQDTIPLSNNEAMELERRVISTGDMDEGLRIKRFKCISRAKAKSIYPRDNSPLSDRIYSDDIHWDKATVKYLHEKRRVYDFIVPDSKVFAVNDGLIVFDTCSWIPIFSEEANKECLAYMKTTGNYVLPSGEPLADMCDDLCKISFYAMTRDVPELKK